MRGLMRWLYRRRVGVACRNWEAERQLSVFRRLVVGLGPIIVSINALRLKGGRAAGMDGSLWMIWQLWQAH